MLFNCRIILITISKIIRLNKFCTMTENTRELSTKFTNKESYFTISEKNYNHSDCNFTSSAKILKPTNGISKDTSSSFNINCCCSFRSTLNLIHFIKSFNATIRCRFSTGRHQISPITILKKTNDTIDVSSNADNLRRSLFNLTIELKLHIKSLDIIRN